MTGDSDAAGEKRSGHLLIALPFLRESELQFQKSEPQTIRQANGNIAQNTRQGGALTPIPSTPDLSMAQGRSQISGEAVLNRGSQDGPESPNSLTQQCQQLESAVAGLARP